jgi:hypothetical protein
MLYDVVFDAKLWALCLKTFYKKRKRDKVQVQEELLTKEKGLAL